MRTGARTLVGRRMLALFVLLFLLALGCLLAISVGTTWMPAKTVIAALVHFDGSRDHILIIAIRLPRVLTAIIAGSALAVSGAIMQAVTNNPLASPGLLGINAGAAFAVVTMMTLTGSGSGSSYIWFAFGGAGAAAVVVYALGSVGGIVHHSLGLILAGAVVTAFLTSLTGAVLIFDQSTLDAVRLWTAGSVSGRTLAEILDVAPYVTVALAASLFIGRHLTALSLGPDASRAIGQNTALWRGVSVVIVMLLAGGAVALAGPIGFVGLIVPHIVRFMVGVDYRWILPFCAMGGAFLVVIADMMGRTLFASQSFPVGVTIALVGAPFFLWLARTRVRAET